MHALQIYEINAMHVKYFLFKNLKKCFGLMFSEGTGLGFYFTRRRNERGGMG